MAFAADMTLSTIVFICGIWLVLIPMGLMIFVNVKAWHRTDPTLSDFERFNQAISSSFWENVLIFELSIVLQKVMRWAFRYYSKHNL